MNNKIKILVNAGSYSYGRYSYEKLILQLKAAGVQIFRTNPKNLTIETPNCKVRFYAYQLEYGLDGLQKQAHYLYNFNKEAENRLKFDYTNNDVTEHYTVSELIKNIEEGIACDAAM